MLFTSLFQDLFFTLFYHLSINIYSFQTYHMTRLFMDFLANQYLLLLLPYPMRRVLIDVQVVGAVNKAVGIERFNFRVKDL